MSCSFCNENFESIDAISKHLMICGNKTDQCPVCHKYVRRAIFTYHYENKCADPDTDSINDRDYRETELVSSMVIPISYKCAYCNYNCDLKDRKIHKVRTL